MLKKVAFTFLCSAIGGVFLLSGYTKLYPIEPFEYTFVDLGFINWQIAPFVARFMIGLEFFIGFLLFFNLNLRKIAYKSGIITLLIFCVYLILLIFFTGNKGNCGCFGSYIQMTPLQALIKNVVMLGIFFLLYKYHEGWEIKGKWKILTILFLVSSFVMPFILNPVELDYSEAYLNKPEENFKLELDTLYQHATLYTPPKALSQGKHIIVFMSLTCPHCRIAANKIRIIHEKNPQLPFYFVLNGEEKNLEPFFENTHTQDIPYCMLTGGDDKIGNYFVYAAKTSELPAIYLVNNGVVEHNVYYIDLDQSEVEKWYTSP